jgi:hypothetical protein
MNKYFYFFLLLVLLTSSAYTQNDRILWSKKSLKWKDFKGLPDSTSEFAASTRSGVEKRYHLTPQGELQFIIAAWFWPGNSWVKNGIASDYTLAHEQLHFTLSELYARKMRKYLSEAAFYDSTYRVGVPALLKHFQEEVRNEQKRYDAETDHGKNKSKQEDWAASIREEMKRLSGYSDTLLVVKLH